MNTSRGRRIDPETHEVICRLCGRSFKAIAWSHLAFAHGMEQDHPILDYKARYRLKRSRSIETQELLSRLRRQAFAKNRAKVASRILEEIRNRHRRGLPLNGAAFPRNSYLAARSCFGSWEAALTRCGIRHADVRRNGYWTVDRLRSAILERALTGKRLDGYAVVQEQPALMNAAMKYCGSWERAVRAAGFDYAKVRRYRKWTRTAILRYLRERKRHGLPLNRYAVARDVDVTDAAIRIFGSWDRALEECGFRAAEIRLRRPNWTRETLVAEIHRRKRAGEPLNTGAVKNQMGLLKGARRLFGSWKHALSAAGVEYPDVRPRWTRERLLAAVRHFVVAGPASRSNRLQRERGLRARAKELSIPWEEVWIGATRDGSNLSS